MSRVLKYVVPVEDGDVKVEMGRDAKILHVGRQHGGEISVWVEAPANPTYVEVRVFRVIGTGFNVPEEFEYVGSVLDGIFVWHLYERRRG